MWSAIITLILMSLSLAMDAFSVALIDGLTIRDYSKKKMLFTSFIFGLFQALLPLLGHLIGLTFIDYIKDYDHWISLALLSIIGIKMIVEASKELYEKNKAKKEINSENKISEEEKCKKFTYKLIITQGIATAIDAFAVGITLETSITPINVYIGLATIGVVTFLCCLAASYLGKGISKLIKGKAEILEIIGGVILILIGIKIVLNHLGIISF